LLTKITIDPEKVNSSEFAIGVAAPAHFTGRLSAEKKRAGPVWAALSVRAETEGS
jgi:hypothetical protein